MNALQRKMQPKGQEKAPFRKPAGFARRSSLFPSLALVCSRGRLELCEVMLSEFRARRMLK